MTMIPLYGASDAAYGSGIEEKPIATRYSSHNVAVRCTPPCSSGTYGDDDSGSDDCRSSMSSVSMTSSSSADDDSMSGYSSGDDLGDIIPFLREKQLLLQRAIGALKREEIYAATIAVGVASSVHPSVSISSVFQDAKDALRRINGDDTETIESSSSIATAKRQSPVDHDESSTESTKRIKIDTRSVRHFSGSEAEGNAMLATASGRPQEPFPMEGSKWMARALMNNFKPTTSSSDSSSEWKVVRDPYMGSLAIPPSTESCQREMQLRDALGFTPTPQVITSAVSPFAVVHANRAFSVLCGEQNFVGKSVESLFQVEEDSSTASSGETKTFPTRIRLQNQDCQLCLIPIIDRAASKRGAISHILLKAQLHQNASGDAYTNASSSTLMRSSFVDSLDEESTSSGMGFSTVG